MGLSDREYYREETRGFFLGGDRSAVTNLILINVLIFIVDQFTPSVSHNPFGPGGDRWLSNFMAMRVDSLIHPWEWWRLLSAGFAHDPGSVWHLGFNMLGLYLFGRDIETHYGRVEFYFFYIAAIVASSLIWGLHTWLAMPLARNASMVGASGAVMAVLILCAFNFPWQTILIGFILPVPIWLLALLYVASNVAGMTQAHSELSGVAYSAHLGGAAFAFMYYQFHWNVSRWWPRSWDPSQLRNMKNWLKFRRRPKLRIHNPSPVREVNLDEEVDRILDKITREGESSLTPTERSTLEDASRRYQRRRQ